MLLPSQALTLDDVTAMIRSINLERVETEEPLRDGDSLAGVDLEFTPVYGRNGTLSYFLDSQEQEGILYEVMQSSRYVSATEAILTARTC